MKTLQESLFDRDLIEKDVPGHQLKDIMFFDGQCVYKLRQGLSRVIIPTGDYDRDNALGAIDWKEVKKDLKKWGGDKIDLGRYAYANADKYIMRNSDTNKKTEDFARLILSIPYTEEYYFGGFNSRFREEFTPKLDKYILSEYKDESRGKCFYFEVDCRSRFGCSISLYYGGYNPANDPEVLRWEFMKKTDD